VLHFAHIPVQPFIVHQIKGGITAYKKRLQRGVPFFEHNKVGLRVQRTKNKTG
jgi:hypothetical protein